MILMFQILEMKQVWYGMKKGEKILIPKGWLLVPKFLTSFWIADAFKNLNFVVATAKEWIQSGNKCLQTF